MTLETLLAERDIYRQLIRFARAMDNRDSDEMSAVAVSTLVADLGTGEVHGSAEVIAFILSFLDNCGATQHMLANVLIEVEGDEATSSCYVSDMHLSQKRDSDAYFRTLGSYTDSWAKVDGVWLLTRRRKDNRAVMGSMEVFDGA